MAGCETAVVRRGVNDASVRGVRSARSVRSARLAAPLDDQLQRAIAHALRRLGHLRHQGQRGARQDAVIDRGQVAISRGRVLDALDEAEASLEDQGRTTVGTTRALVPGVCVHGLANSAIYS